MGSQKPKLSINFQRTFVNHKPTLSALAKHRPGLAQKLTGHLPALQAVPDSLRPAHSEPKVSWVDCAAGTCWRILPYPAPPCAESTDYDVRRRTAQAFHRECMLTSGDAATAKRQVRQPRHERAVARCRTRWNASRDGTRTQCQTRAVSPEFMKTRLRVHNRRQHSQTNTSGLQRSRRKAANFRSFQDQCQRSTMSKVYSFIYML